ncbi:MAG: mycothiol synthase [Acidimicrobiales bacterium]
MSVIPEQPGVVVVTELDTPLAETARAVFRRALPIDLRDDRFDAWPSADVRTGAPGPVVAAVARAATGPIAVVWARPAHDVLSLDALVAADATTPADVLDRLYLAAVDAAPPAERIDWWGRPALDAHADVAARRGLVEHRSLHQMRCRLPVEVEPLPTRPFDPETDIDALLAVNNRAFAFHPDQGDLSAADLRAAIAEPWFRADGIRLHEREGRLAGFCWTKIHPARVEDGERSSELGEIYVIGIDPDFHGQGLGAPMTAAGLRWMSDHGQSTGMLYVEADNVPAIKTYERLGFTVVRTDRAWTTETP